MLHPSYTELMEKINNDEEATIVQSRYSIVKAASARAKQIIDWRSTSEKLEKRIAQDPNNPEPTATKEEIYALTIGKPQIPNMEDRKPLSIAVEELYNGKVKIIESN